MPPRSHAAALLQLCRRAFIPRRSYICRRRSYAVATVVLDLAAHMPPPLICHCRSYMPLPLICRCRSSVAAPLSPLLCRRCSYTSPLLCRRRSYATAAPMSPQLLYLATLIPRRSYTSPLLYLAALIPCRSHAAARRSYSGVFNCRDDRISVTKNTKFNMYCSTSLHSIPALKKYEGVENLPLIYQMKPIFIKLTWADFGITKFYLFKQIESRAPPHVFLAVKHFMSLSFLVYNL